MEGPLPIRGYLPSSIILETISLVNMFFKIFKKLVTWVFETWVWWQTRAVKTWVLVLAWNNLSMWKSFKPIWFGLMRVWKIQTQNHTNILREKKKTLNLVQLCNPWKTLPLKNKSIAFIVHIGLSGWIDWIIGFHAH